MPLLRRLAFRFAQLFWILHNAGPLVGNVGGVVWYQFPCHLFAWGLHFQPLTVQEVIPSWPLWSAATEEELAWTAVEQDMLSDARLGTDERVLNVQGQAPTALHSWSVAPRPCPCDCRSTGFSLVTTTGRWPSGCRS